MIDTTEQVADAIAQSLAVMGFRVERRGARLLAQPDDLVADPKEAQLLLRAELEDVVRGGDLIVTFRHFLSPDVADALAPEELADVVADLQESLQRRGVEDLVGTVVVLGQLAYHSDQGMMVTGLTVEHSWVAEPEGYEDLQALTTNLSLLRRALGRIQSWLLLWSHELV